MVTFFQLLYSGLGQGMVLGVFGFALAFLFQVCNVINVAIGEFAMMAVLASVTMVGAGIPTALAIVICVVGAIIVALLYERFVLAPTIRRPSSDRVLQLFLLTFALSMLMQGVALRAFGRNVFALPPFFGNSAFRIGGVAIDKTELLVIGVGLELCAGTYLFTKKTLYGKALTAVGINERGAVAVGISPVFYRRLAISISCVLAVVIGTLVSPIIAFNYSSGFLLAVTGLLAATIAGLRNPVLALTVGVGVGLLQSLVGGYVSGTYQGVVALAILTAIVLARPNVVNAR